MRLRRREERGEERERPSENTHRERSKGEGALQQPIDVCPTNTLKYSRESHQNALQKGIGEMRERERERKRDAVTTIMSEAASAPRISPMEKR